MKEVRLKPWFYLVSVLDVSAFLSNTNSLSALALTDSILLASATTIDETIPEESAVEVGDTSYAPMESPSSEPLPPLPPVYIDPGVGVNVIAPLDLSDATPVDLDAQIEELESELERCKTGETNHTGAPPGGVDVTDGEIPSPFDDGEVDTVSDTPTTPVDPDVAAQSHHQRGLSVCRALTIVFFVVFTVMVATLLFVMESELDVPVLTELRQMPELQHFKRQHYNPLKVSLARRAGRWFK